MSWFSSIGGTLTDSFMFGGRSTRTQFWAFAVFAVVFAVVIWQEGAMIATINVLGGIGVFLAVIAFAFSFAMAIPLVSVSVRRLHDINRSGWWLVLAPTMLVFALTPSTPGVNRFGDPSHD